MMGAVLVMVVLVAVLLVVSSEAGMSFVDSKEEGEEEGLRFFLISLGDTGLDASFFSPILWCYQHSS